MLFYDLVTVLSVIAVSKVEKELRSNICDLCIYCLQLSGREMGNSRRGHGVLPFHVERMWFKLAVTSSNWFLPVVVHDKLMVSRIVWLVVSLLIWTLAKEVVYCRLSGLKLSVTVTSYQALNYDVHKSEKCIRNLGKRLLCLGFE